jgi:hypothetical protein
MKRSAAALLFFVRTAGTACGTGRQFFVVPGHFSAAGQILSAGVTKIVAIVVDEISNCAIFMTWN